MPAVPTNAEENRSVRVVAGGSVDGVHSNPMEVEEGFERRERNNPRASSSANSKADDVVVVEIICGDKQREANDRDGSGVVFVGF